MENKVTILPLKIQILLAYILLLLRFIMFEGLICINLDQMIV